MTLIAGFRCKDGFVMAADTEITLPNVISFQGHKLADYYNGSSVRAFLVGIAGHMGYGLMASQKVRDGVQALTDPTFAEIKTRVEEVIKDIHEELIFKLPEALAAEAWFQLLIGVEDKERQFGILKTESTSVAEVEHYAFAGTGQYLAEHLAEKLFDVFKMSAAVTEHLVQQIFREVKGKGAFVGGNTEIITRRSTEDAERFFDLGLSNKAKGAYRFLWGLDDAILSAVRVAINAQAGDRLLEERLRFVRAVLKRLRRDAKKEQRAPGDQHHLTEFGTEYGNPFKDT